MLNKIAILGINCYQNCISPYKGYKCAFSYYTNDCSCSEFAKNCIIKYGVIKSIPLFKQRLKKCRAIYFSKQKTEPKKEVDVCNELAGVCACL